jgi:ribosomal protein S18 acetylase RimI-like enzyme
VNGSTGSKAPCPSGILVDGIYPNAAATRADKDIAPLLDEVSALSKASFQEDCISTKNCSNKSGWRLSILRDSDTGALQGFVIFRCRTDLKCLSIAKIAVSPEFRRMGLGSKMVSLMAQKGRKQGLEAISLSSLKEAVPFYKKLGFKVMPDVDTESQLLPGEELIEGQVYMEKRLHRKK